MFSLDRVLIFPLTLSCLAYQMRLLDDWGVVNKTLIHANSISLGDDLGFQFNGHDKEKREFSLLVAVRGKLIVTILESTNINHKGLQRTPNEYAEERRIYKDLISKNNNP